MQWKNNRENYGLIAKTLHWLTAILVFGMLAVGISLSYLPRSTFKSSLVNLHKSFGLLLLAIMLLRLIWRLTNPSVTLPATMQKWRRVAARSSHYLFYVLIITMPLDGIIMSTLMGYPPNFFHLFTLPQFLSINKAAGSFFFDIHVTLAWCISSLICLHVLAVIDHHWRLKEKILQRMC